MKKLYRSRRNKMVMGLCGGLSEMLNVDATLLRILLIVATIFSGGTVIFIYLIAGLVVPKEPNMYGGYGGPYGGYGNDGYGGGYGNNGYGGGYGTGSGGGHHNSTFSSNNKWSSGYGKDEPAPGPQFDSMMDDLEKKALRREIEELKAKIAKQEKGE